MSIDPGDSRSSIRAQGEADRTPEFKEKRDQIIGQINLWLTAAAGIQKNNVAFGRDAQPLLDAPRINVTNLGLISPGQRLNGQELLPGASLTGDGVEKPLIFQSVKQDSETGELEILEVRGSDPLTAAVYKDEGYNLSRSQEIIASFSCRTRSHEGEQYFGFEFMGDGKVKRQNLNLKGQHNNESVNSSVDLEMAELALHGLVDTL